jgi:hypothetical protein
MAIRRLGWCLSAARSYGALLLFGFGGGASVGVAIDIDASAQVTVAGFDQCRCCLDLG